MVLLWLVINVLLILVTPNSNVLHCIMSTKTILSAKLKHNNTLSQHVFISFCSDTLCVLLFISSHVSDKNMLWSHFSILWHSYTHLTHKYHQEMFSPQELSFVVAIGQFWLGGVMVYSVPWIYAQQYVMWLLCVHTGNYVICPLFHIDHCSLIIIIPGHSDM